MDLYLNIADGIIHVLWDCNSLTDNLTRLFSPWQVRIENVRPQKKYEIAVAKSSEGFQVSSPHRPPEICPDELILFSTLEYFITLLALDILHNHISYHASVIDMNGSGTMIVGDHDSGKTTLALTAISLGFRALSDEVGVILDDCKTAIGFPRPFRIKKNTRDLNPSVIPSCCSTLRISDELSYIFFDDYYSPSTKLKYIFFPELRPGETSLRMLGETEAFRRILPQGFRCNLQPDCWLKDIIRLIHNVSLYEITFHDNWDAIRTIRDMLEEKS